MKWISFILLTGCAAAIMVRVVLLENPILIVAQESGRLGIQAKNPYTSTAIDLSPTSASFPLNNSLAELTIYRTNGPYGPGTPMERFNISAMASHTPDDAAYYRFGVEADYGGVHRGMIFCFENVEGNRANCRLLIDPDGVWVNKAQLNNEPDWWKL